MLTGIPEIDFHNQDNQGFEPPEGTGWLFIGMMVAGLALVIYCASQLSYFK